MDNIEKWLPIPLFEGLYEASNMGNIRSVLRFLGRRRYPSVIKTQNIKKGYSFVELHNKGVRKRYSVHRLILLTFVGPSELQADHINGIKTDNRLENLEYVTCAENIKRYRSSIMRNLPAGVYSASGDRFRSRVKINDKWHSLGTFSSIEEAVNIRGRVLAAPENMEEIIGRKKAKYIYQDGNRFRVIVRVGRERVNVGSYGSYKAAEMAYARFMKKM